MKAKITKTVNNAKNLAPNREVINTWNLIANTNKGLIEVISCCVYMGRSSNASLVHASIWVNSKDHKHTSGYGNAGGGGYHKESAAIDEAIANAGITLDKHIDGVGDSAIHEAFEAIAKAAGYKGNTIIVRN